MKQYTYHAIINNIGIESNNIDVLVENINNTIGFPTVTRDSVFNYFNRPERNRRLSRQGGSPDQFRHPLLC
jgi:hypothetical protein